MRRILVVDDDPGVVEMIELFLSKEEIEICKAFSGKEAVELIKAGYQGLVMMDVQMPEMDGWDTIRELKKQNLLSGIFLCMLTGIDDPGESGADVKELVLDYLVKPIMRGSVLEVVDNAKSLLGSTSGQN